MDDGILPSLADDARRLADIALAEDGPCDLTTDVTVTTDSIVDATLEARAKGTMAGTPYAECVARACGLHDIDWLESDGNSFVAGQRLGVLTGSLRAILKCERPMLNLLQRACGIATTTRAYVEALRGTQCRVLHTRKTLPGLRAFDVRAVISGGGGLHRLDLAHAVLVKDNHWRSLEKSGITLVQARKAALARGQSAFQVEVESKAQVEAACAAGATRILVDNQAPQTLKEWAALSRRLSPGIEVEATGGIDLNNARAYADAGADFVSIGALTHSVRALDISLEVSVRSGAP